MWFNFDSTLWIGCTKLKIFLIGALWTQSSILCTHSSSSIEWYLVPHQSLHITDLPIQSPKFWQLFCDYKFLWVQWKLRFDLLSLIQDIFQKIVEISSCRHENFCCKSRLENDNRDNWEFVTALRIRTSSSLLFVSLPLCCTPKPYA